MKFETIFGSYFCGNKISEYGRQNGRVDYATLAKSFDAVLNNTIYGAGWELGEWEEVNGDLYDKEEEREREIYQWYIISESGAGILSDYTNELILYNESLDIYLWGVDHYGTSWDYVLTEIKCKKEI